mgnify:CR=1 FL=1
MLTGNSFSRDSDGERTERLVLLSANIGDVAVELGLTPDKLAEAESAGTDWDEAKFMITVSTISTPFIIATSAEARPYPGVQWL